MFTLKYPIILASGSPRRKEILELAGFDFNILVKPTSEIFDKNLSMPDIPLTLSMEKASLFAKESKKNIIICADTIVALDNNVLNKPIDELEAKQMLRSLSGKMHQVYTGVTILSPENQVSFVDRTEVFFKHLTDWEIDYYIKTCHPLDKAGAYGIQDFIGMAGIERIDGSFYTVMGLPIHRVYEVLKKFIIK